MIFEKRKMDLFRVDEKYYLAHCISADYVLGAGIAVLFEKKFKLRRNLNSCGNHTFPSVIKMGKVFNLITKEKCWHKPTLQNLEITLIQMKEMCLKDDIKFLAMPKIGCGLDKLSWDEVEPMIKRVFDNTDIEILVCYLD